MPLILAGLLADRAAFGQLDPEKRELIQVGYDQPVQGAAPTQGYGYYYLNEPNFFKTNVTFRLALAPVYLDSDTGFVGLLGPHTDVGLGLAGGGFADNYYEFHDGKYLPQESFFGHDLEISGSIYHLFNPEGMIPLNGVLRIKEHYSIYARDDTSSAFALPDDHSTVDWRMGLRWGGREPLLHPDLAMEMSAWYEGEYRTDAGPYGFNDDRVMKANSQLFWGRALLIYTMPSSQQSFALNLTGGGSLGADRFSAYRVGGSLMMESEFPLMIPGYFENELSARDFACLTGEYTIPLVSDKSWTLNPIGSVATMEYIPGMEQPSHFNSGVGMGVGYQAHSGAWRAEVSYGYGFEAIRSTGRGGQSVGLSLEINLEAKHPNRNSPLEHVTKYLLAPF